MLHPRHHDAVVDLLAASVDTAPVRPRAHRMLGPGERIVEGRIHSSAAWLGVAAPLEPEAVKAAPAPVDPRSTLTTTPEGV